jgi:hypothetical protein
VMLPKFLPDEDPAGLHRVFPRYAAPPGAPKSSTGKTGAA